MKLFGPQKKKMKNQLKLKVKQKRKKEKLTQDDVDEEKELQNEFPETELNPEAEVDKTARKNPNP